MFRPKIFVHGSYVGTTGYNNHTRDFFRELSKYSDIKVRNFTVGKSWNGYSDNCHDGEKYLDDLDKKLLYQQILWVKDGLREDFKIYQHENKEFYHDLNLILSETNHHLFYDKYYGPKIAYNVWESTKQPEVFFEKLKEFDELWVPSEWQKICSIEQGYDPNKIEVVPEGVDVNTFFPENVELLEEYKDGRFKFILFGRWDYRKSSKEIIETFLRTFDLDEPVDLIVSIDNLWGEKMDGHKTTEERLQAYGLTDQRIKIVHFPSREDYIKFIKIGHVFVSCARAEGWNLPLIEAMACGTPSIYSNCSAQLEFAKNKGLPVKIKGTRNANDNDYGRYTMSDLPGEYYEPDFDDLSRVMRYAYENYEGVKKSALKDSELIRRDFSWERIGEIGFETIKKFSEKFSDKIQKHKEEKNEIFITFIDGPKVEIRGNRKEKYFIEFIDSEKNSVVYSDTIENNMWTSCSRKYFTKWIIKINGNVAHEFNCLNQRILICLESRSMGDTIAWAPYAVDFAIKNNCKVVLSTFHNDWFRNVDYYKNIEFMEPGNSTDVYCVYRIGWFKNTNGLWDKMDLCPNIQNTIPLQQTATDILGLEYYEMNYGVDYSPKPKPIPKKYVVFGPNATAGAKEWKYESWVRLSEMFLNDGYTVVSLTKHPFKINNVINICNRPIQEVMNYLYHSEFFVGLGSGLSWLNWALGKKTIMINGFSQEGHEFTTNVLRISNDICIKCWNDPVLPFDPRDWNWCPVYKGTSKQHICQTSISPNQVYNKIKIWLT